MSDLIGLTLGERRVRTSFNPGDDKLVTLIKDSTAELINLVSDALEPPDSEAARLQSLAMTHYEEAGMWAVKAATYQSPE